MSELYQTRVIKVTTVLQSLRVKDFFRGLTSNPSRGLEICSDVSYKNPGSALTPRLLVRNRTIQMCLNETPTNRKVTTFWNQKLAVVPQLRAATEAPRRGRALWMKPEVRGTSFLPATLPSFGGYIRADETNVEIPQTRKVAVNQIPAMGAVCVDIPFFFLLFLSLLFSQFLRSLSLSVRLSVPLSLPLSPSSGIWI